MTARKTSCGAKNRHGGRCGLGRGHGTDHPGVGACKFHGGSTPAGRKAARATIAKAVLAELAVPIPTTPMRLLQDLVDRANGMVQTAARMLHQIDSNSTLSSEDAQVRIRLLRETMIEAGRLAKMAAEAINEEALVAIDQRTGEIIHRILMAGLEAHDRAGGGPAGRKAAEDVVTRELVAVGPSTDQRN